MKVQNFRDVAKQAKSEPLHPAPCLANIKERALRRTQKMQAMQRLAFVGVVVVGMAAVGLAMTREDSSSTVTVAMEDALVSGQDRTSEHPQWRLEEVASEFISEPFGYRFAVDQASLDSLSVALGFEVSNIDIASEVVVAQSVLVHSQEGNDCGSIVVASVGVIDGKYQIEYVEGETRDGTRCGTADRYQVFVAVLQRSELPDTFIIPYRAALLEVPVR